MASEIEPACGIWNRDHRCRVSMDAVKQLKRYHRETVPESYLDAMGHMNVRWYSVLFDTASWNLFRSIGMNADYFSHSRSGSFALKHFIQYYAEVKAGDTVAVHIRMLGRSEKRFHLMHFMVNETSDAVAATLEGLGTHADLIRRRSSPIPEQLAAILDARLKADQALGWEAPLCGVIGV